MFYNFFQDTDSLSKPLQNSEMLACEGQTMASLSIKTLEKMCNDLFFDSIWDLIKLNRTSLDLPEPTILRKCKKPAKYLGEQDQSSWKLSLNF